MIISLQSSLGIQFSKEYLLLVYLKKFLKEIVIDRHELIPYPLNLSKEEWESYCLQEISRFIKENRVGKENVWVGIPRSEVLLRFITLPFSAEENLPEVIRYELGKYIPFPEEDIYFDFITLEKDGEEKTLRILLMVIKKEVLERYLSIFKKVGITPLGMELSFSSLLNLFLLGGENGTGTNGPVALINIESQIFEIIWVSKGVPKYSRAVEFKTDRVTDRVREIEEEVRNSFRVTFPIQAQKEREGKESSLVFLTGNGVKGDLIESLNSSGAIKVQILPTADISSRLNFSDSFPPELTPGVGLALRGINRVPWNINILPQPLRKKTSKIGLYLSFFLFFMGLILLSTLGMSIIVKDRIELNNLQREINSLKSEVISIQNIQNEAQKIINRIECLKKIKDSEFSKLEILKELSNILPSSVWLTSFRYYKQEIQISGYAASASDLIAVLDSSPLFSSSEFTAPITRDQRGRESFKIKTRIERR